MKTSIRILCFVLVGLTAGCNAVVGDDQKNIERNQGVKEVGQAWKTWTDPTTGMEFVRIAGGCFQMGNPDYLKLPDQDEGPVHEVCLDGFYLGRFEVTVGEFSRFSETTGYQSEVGLRDVCTVDTGAGWVRLNNKNWNNHNFSQQQNEPVVCVSWTDARRFAQWLKGQKGGRPYRLPTEAEWEYAARAGSDTTSYWGEIDTEACGYGNVHDLSSISENTFTATAFNCNDGHPRTAPVGSFRANGFGLYDMLGNVWEWTENRYGKDYYASNGNRNNPKGPGRGSLRVARGGAWANGLEHVRFACRSKTYPDERYEYMGFRLAFSVVAEGEN